MMTFRAPTLSSSTLKLQYLNSWLKGIAVNTAVIYFTATFISQVGAPNYSNLFLYSTLATILFFTSSIALKSRSGHYLYLAIALSFFAASMFYPLFPKNTLVISIITFLAFTADMAGANTCSTSLQLTISPAFLRKAYTKTSSIDITTKVIGSILAVFALRYDAKLLLLSVLWPALIMHLLVFARITSRIPADTQHTSKRVEVKFIWDSAKVIFTNRMLRFFIYLGIWAYGMKFVIELSFFKELELFYPKAKDLGPFFGTLNIITLALTLTFQKLLLPKIVSNLRMTSIFSILPMGVLCLAILFAFVNHFFAASFLFFFFQIIYRGLQVPLSREVFTLVPPQFQKNVSFIVSLVLAMGGLIVSTVAAAYQSELTTEYAIILVAGITTPVIFLLSNLSSQYLDNLWVSLRDKIKFSSKLSSDASFELGAKIEDGKTSTRLKTNALIHSLKNSQADNHGYKTARIIHTYYQSFDTEELARATNDHLSLLNSADDDDVELGLIVCEMIGLACFETKVLQIAKDHPTPQIKRLASAVLDSIGFLSRYHLAGLSIETQTKVRFLLTKSFQTGKDIQRRAIKHLIMHSDKRTVKAFIDAMFDTKFKTIRRDLISCAHNDSERISLVPLFRAFCHLPHAESLLYRQFLATLDPLPFKIEINQFLLQELNTLKLNHIDTSQHQFANLLFINEWLLLRKVKDELLTIDQIFEEASDEVLMIRNLHQEIIKKSKFHPTWKNLFYNLKTKCSEESSPRA